MPVTVQKDDVGKGGSKFRLIIKFDQPEPVRRKDIRVEYPANSRHCLRIFLHDRCFYKLRLYGNIDRTTADIQPIEPLADAKLLTITMPKLTAVTESWIAPGRCSPGSSSNDSSD